MKKALIIFVRKPELGKVKTRIGNVLGDDLALEIYQRLLAHTRQITAGVKATRFIYYTDRIDESSFFNEDIFIKRVQSAGDLGDKMHSAFTDLFNEGFEQICVIGSDCFELQTDLIESAFMGLESNDIVIGPAWDGGYYLLGMSKKMRPIFANISWSTAKVFDQTLECVVEQQLSYSLLPVLSDVDTVSDLPVTWKQDLGLPA